MSEATPYPSAQSQVKITASLPSGDWSVFYYPTFLQFLVHINKSLSSPIPIFETQVKCWHVYQDLSNDFRHFSIPAEKGTTSIFFLTWHPGSQISRYQFLDRDFSVTAGERSKERKSNDQWITRIKAGSHCFPLDNILPINRSGQSSSSWLLLPSCRCSGKSPQELALLGWWLTPCHLQQQWRNLLGSTALLGMAY